MASQLTCSINYSTLVTKQINYLVKHDMGFVISLIHPTGEIEQFGIWTVKILLTMDYKMKP